MEQQNLINQETELKAKLYEKNEQLANLLSKLGKISDLNDELEEKEYDLQSTRWQIDGLKSRKKGNKVAIVLGIISLITGLVTQGYYFSISAPVRGFAELAFAFFGLSLALTSIKENKDIKREIYAYSKTETKLLGEVEKLQKEVEDSKEEEINLNKSKDDLQSSIEATQEILNGIIYVNKEDSEVVEDSEVKEINKENDFPRERMM